MKRVLVVEDDSFLNKMLSYNLTADGYEITSVLNARTAAQALNSKEFDLVLLDINLPDGNGYDLCKLIKPEHADTIVIFLTANDQESDQIRGYEVGAVDYITKPFVIGALQRKIKAMFSMLEHHKPARDIYDDGRLFLDFSEQTASLNGKASDSLPDGVQNAEPVPQKSQTGFDPRTAFRKAMGRRRKICRRAYADNDESAVFAAKLKQTAARPTLRLFTVWVISGREAKQNEKPLC